MKWENIDKQCLKRWRSRIIVIVRNKNNNSPMLATLPLATMFKDQTYAWQLLESEILIETVQQPQGQDISNLLQLYMRGVEVMNTCMDPRESYFRSKVTALMAKNTVRKTFKAKQEDPPKPAVEVKKEQPRPEEPKRTPKKEAIKKSTEGFVSASALQEKKKELELRLAYATEEHNPEGLRKIIAQNKQAEIQLVSKVEKLMQSHEERLNERINRRKLKTATYRSRAEDQSETLQALDQDSANNDVVAVPISNQPAPLNLIPEVIAEHQPQESRRMHRSADAKAMVVRESSERKEEAKEAVPRDRRLSLHVLRDMLRVC